MAKRSNLSEEERLRRKRLAARLRQQRCRERKRNRERNEQQLEQPRQQRQQAAQPSSSSQTQQRAAVNEDNNKATTSPGLPLSSTVTGAPLHSHQQVVATADTGARHANSSPHQGFPIPSFHATAPSSSVTAIAATAGTAPTAVNSNSSNDHSSRYVLIQPRPASVSSTTAPPLTASVNTASKVDVQGVPNVTFGGLQSAPTRVGNSTSSAFQPYSSNPSAAAADTTRAQSVPPDQHMKTAFLVDETGRIIGSCSNGDIMSLSTKITPSASVPNFQTMVTAAPPPSMPAPHETNNRFIVTSQAPAAMSTTSGPVYVITETRYVLPSVAAPSAAQAPISASGHQLTLSSSSSSNLMPPPPVPSHVGQASSVASGSVSVPAGTILSNGQLVTGATPPAVSNPPVVTGVNNALIRIVSQNSGNGHQEIQQTSLNQNGCAVENSHSILKAQAPATVLSSSTPAAQETTGTFQEGTNTSKLPCQNQQQPTNVISAFRRVVAPAAPPPAATGTMGVSPKLEAVANMTPNPSQRKQQQPLMASQLILPSWSIDSQDAASAATSRVAVPTYQLRRALILSPPPTPACINAAASVTNSSSCVPSGAIPQIPESDRGIKHHFVEHQKQTKEHSLPPRKRRMVEFKEAPVFLQPSSRNEQTDRSTTKASPVRSNGEKESYSASDPAESLSPSHASTATDGSPSGSPVPVEAVGTFSTSPSPNTPGSLYHRRSASEVAKIEAVDAILSLKSPDRTSPLSPFINSTSSTQGTPKKRASPMMPTPVRSPGGVASKTSQQKDLAPLMPRISEATSEDPLKKFASSVTLTLDKSEETQQTERPQFRLIRPSLAQAVSPTLQPKREESQASVQNEGKTDDSQFHHSRSAPETESTPKKKSVVSTTEEIVATPEGTARNNPSWTASQNSLRSPNKVSPDGSHFESFESKRIS